MAGDFQQVEVAGEVGVEVGVGVGDRIAHPGLCAEVDDALEIVGGEGGDGGFVIGEVLADEGEARAAVLREAGEAGFLQARIVVVVHAIEADDLVTAGEQAQRQAVADEAGGAGDEDFHARVP